MTLFNATIYRAATVSSKTICILSHCVYNRVEDENNTADNDNAITAIHVINKKTCIPFTLGV